MDIDVSKCIFYRDNYVTHMCGIEQHGACKDYPNCYYRQLQLARQGLYNVSRSYKSLLKIKKKLDTIEERGNKWN